MLWSLGCCVGEYQISKGEDVWEIVVGRCISDFKRSDFSY